MLPQGIAGIASDKPLSDRKTVAVGAERLGAIALRKEHTAHLVVSDREIALPAGIDWICLGKTRGDRQLVQVGVSRRREISLRQEHIADLVVCDR